jgi:hypothetical protein
LDAGSPWPTEVRISSAVGDALAALVPRPHKNLVVYHGVLAANAAWRSRVVAYGRQGDPVTEGDVEDAPTSNPPRYLATSVG